MQLIMDDKQIQTLEQVKQFVASSQTIEFRCINTNEKYQWIGGARKVKYQRLKRSGKGMLRKYVEKIWGDSGSTKTQRSLWGIKYNEIN
jgi:hypothetical protein